MRKVAVGGLGPFLTAMGRAAIVGALALERTTSAHAALVGAAAPRDRDSWGAARGCGRHRLRRLG
jgi:hypothetical protein